MLRFAFTLTLVLLSLALGHGAPGLKRAQQACDGKSCNATCEKDNSLLKDKDVYGKCDEKGICRCYHYQMCDGDTCKNTCQEKHGTEENLSHECVEGVCTCYWSKKCSPTECEAACHKIYAGKPNIEWKCEGASCHCKWHGVVQGTSPEPGSSDSKAEKREETVHLVDSDSFYLEKEIPARAAKKTAQ